jgi:hypothetical protein
MEGSLVAYKVFTNGSVLPASDLNTYLMDQSVMVFSSSATRAAALTAPVEGMLTWLEDVNRYENYNGTAWVALGSSALEFIKADTIGSGVSSHVWTGTFSSTYDSYRIVVSGGVASTATRLRLQLGTDTANHNSNAFTGNYTTNGLTGSVAGNVAYFDYIGAATTSTISGIIDLEGPFIAKQTMMTSTGEKNGTAGSTGGTGSVTTGIHTAATSFTTFNIKPASGTITGGTVAVYGYRKA